MGFIFIRFAEVFVRCLCFPLSTYVIHAVNEDHFIIAQDTGKLWGLRPHTPNQEQCLWTRSVWPAARSTRHNLGSYVALTISYGENILPSVNKISVLRRDRL